MPLEQFYILMQFVLVIYLIAGTFLMANQAIELFGRIKKWRSKKRFRAIETRAPLQGVKKRRDEFGE